MVTNMPGDGRVCVCRERASERENVSGGCTPWRWVDKNTLTHSLTHTHTHTHTPRRDFGEHVSIMWEYTAPPPHKKIIHTHMGSGTATITQPKFHPLPSRSYWARVSRHCVVKNKLAKKNENISSSYSGSYWARVSRHCVVVIVRQKHEAKKKISQQINP